MEIIDRLQYLMKLNSLSASEFADKIDVQRSSISHLFSGRNKPSLEFIQKVLSAFPKVNADWLISGKTIDDNLSNEPLIKLNEELNLKQPEINFSTPTPIASANTAITNSKHIRKILIFYTDNTFEEIIKS